MKEWQIWLLLAILFAFVEMLTPGFVILCLSGGALVAALLALFGLPLAWQILGFALGTMAAFVSVRPLMQKWALKNENRERTNIDRLIGQIATVIEKTDAEEGQVKIGGEFWSARCRDGVAHKIGEKVKVVGIEGNKVLVEKPVSRDL